MMIGYSKTYTTEIGDRDIENDAFWVLSLLY